MFGLGSRRECVGKLGREPDLTEPDLTSAGLCAEAFVIPQRGVSSEPVVKKRSGLIEIGRNRFTEPCHAKCSAREGEPRGQRQSAEQVLESSSWN